MVRVQIRDSLLAALLSSVVLVIVICPGCGHEEDRTGLVSANRVIDEIPWGKCELHGLEMGCVFVRWGGGRGEPLSTATPNSWKRLSMEYRSNTFGEDEKGAWFWACSACTGVSLDLKEDWSMDAPNGQLVDLVCRMHGALLTWVPVPWLDYYGSEIWQDSKNGLFPNAGSIGFGEYHHLNTESSLAWISTCRDCEIAMGENRLNSLRG